MGSRYIFRTLDGDFRVRIARLGDRAASLDGAEAAWFYFDFQLSNFDRGAICTALALHRDLTGTETQLRRNHVDVLVLGGIRRDLQRAMRDGQLQFAPVEQVRFRPLREEVPVATSPAPPPAEKAEQPWVSFRVVDDRTDEPVADIPLLITLPQDSEAEHRTNAEGWVEFDPVKPGTCQIRCDLDGRDLTKILAFERVSPAPPLKPPLENRPELQDGMGIANVLRHRVRNGETMESIAAKHGLSEDDLSQFNFGTTDPKDLAKALRRRVGCSKRDDTNKYVFSNQDDPGIIYVPKPLSLPSLAVNRSHVIRVSLIEPELPPFIFSW